MIGKKLHDLREAADLKQKTIAEAIGMDARYISYWEKDHREPSLDSLKRLCEFFGVSADYLIGITNSKDGTQVSDDQARILNLIGALNEAELHQIELYVEFLLYKRRKREQQSVEYAPDESLFQQEVAEAPEGFAKK